MFDRDKLVVRVAFTLLVILLGLLLILALLPEPASAKDPWTEYGVTYWQRSRQASAEGDIYMARAWAAFADNTAQRSREWQSGAAVHDPGYWTRRKQK